MADMQKITVTGLDTYPAAGQTVTVFSKGVDQYEALSPHIGEEVQIVNGTDDGKYAEGPILGAKVGDLLSLINELGSYNIHTQGRPYSTLSLVQALSRAGGESGPLDVTKLYTVLTVRVDKLELNIKAPL